MSRNKREVFFPERGKLGEYVLVGRVHLWGMVGYVPIAYNKDIRMESDIEKCTMLVMNSGKRHMMDGVELQNQVVIRTLREKESYKYLGILEAETIKQQEMKEKSKKEYIRRNKKLLKIKLYSRSLVRGINVWAVTLVRYSGSFLKWTRKELKQMDQRIGKLMTMQKALHPRNDVDGLYVSKKEGGRELASIEDSVDSSTQRLEDYIEKRRERLITATRKKFRRHEDQENDNNRKTKIGRKATLWTV